ncbi:MAG: hypothetical protein EXS37_00550 [Opitutus sp.]|nr:hypothetical protein [Opitutus sp.]
MDPRLRTFLIGSIAAGMAVWVGIAIANEEYLLATLAGTLCTAGVVAWIGGPIAEAWILAFLVFAYIIGNRGFAQVTPVGGMPLFFGELGLASSLALVTFRHAMQQELPWRRDWLNSLILLLLVLGAGRMVFDVRVYGVLALRDFAMIYYALFFFIAQSATAHDASRRLFATGLTVTFTLLPATSLLADIFPELFFRNLTVRGVPLILYKGDLLATFQFAGFFWLLPRGRFDWRWDWWRGLLAVLSLTLALYNVSRAGMMGLMVALLWLIFARWFRPLLVTTVLCGCGVVGAMLYSVMQEKDITQTRVYAIYEHVQSVVDFSGTMAYQNPDAEDSGDNNRFRLVWWKTIVNETLAGGPVFGLGFGHDIARGFVLAYDPLMEGDFTARSPHSILFTMFGRMGFIGLLVWLSIMVVMAREFLRFAGNVRHEHTPEIRELMVLIAMCWVVLVSACFGVVLEGPMGAIPFWVILGVAHGEIRRLTPSEPDPEAAAVPVFTANAV